MGNVRRFIDKTGMPAESIYEYSGTEPFVLITSTYGFGEVPVPVREFLERNGRNLAGVVASGNRNWGANFAKAGELISEKYRVPLLHKFELSGAKADVEIFTERMREIAETHRTE